MTDWAALEAKRAPARRRIGKNRIDAPTERVVQRQIVKAFRAMGIITVHTPNGSHLAGDAMARMRQSAALKADGQLSGWPDLICISGKGAVGFIEVKKEGGTVSPEQERVATLLGLRGLPVAMVCTLDEAIAAIKQWGFI